MLKPAKLKIPSFSVYIENVARRFLPGGSFEFSIKGSSSDELLLPVLGSIAWSPFVPFSVVDFLEFSEIALESTLFTSSISDEVLLNS